MQDLRRKSGFTILELVLVLVMLVILASLVLPNFKSGLANQRLKKGAELIRAELARARNKAIKTGQTQVFRHLVGSDGYVTSPHFSPEDIVEADERLVFQGIEGTVSIESNTIGITTKMPRLPDDVYFMGADVSVDQRTSSQMVSYNQQSAVVVGNDVDGGESTWGMPIFFFPDGTTSSARIVLANKNNAATTIELRGLTGISQISPMVSVEQIVPLGITQ